MRLDTHPYHTHMGLELAGVPFRHGMKPPTFEDIVLYPNGGACFSSTGIILASERPSLFPLIKVSGLWTSTSRHHEKWGGSHVSAYT